MRTVDILMSIPFMFVLILMLVIFGRSILMLFIGIGLISWLDMARIARGQTLSIKNKEFVEAAVADRRRAAADHPAPRRAEPAGHRHRLRHAPGAADDHLRELHLVSSASASRSR